MTTTAVDLHSRGRTAARALPLGWYLCAVFGAVPVWWALGVGTFVWPILALPLLLALLVHPDARLPRGFGVWLLFLGWTAVSATQIANQERALAFAYRASLYLAATVLFLYIFNRPPSVLPTRRVIKAMGFLFGVVVAGGFAGLLLPDVSFTAPIERLIPPTLAGSKFVQDTVQVEFAGRLLSDLANTPPRPAAPFTYANEWGANFVLLLPFALAAREYVQSRFRRRVFTAFIVSSIIPVVLSGNRGAWLALAVAAAYLGLRFALLRRMRALVAVIALISVVGIVLVATPLGGLAGARLDDPRALSSDRFRANNYRQSLEKAQESPLVGFGAPVRSATRPDEPAIGTHGQILGILVAHGFPGLALFLGWLAYTLWRLSRGGSRTAFWAHLVVLLAMVEMLYYELLPLGFLIVMVAAGLGWREVRWPAKAAPEPA
jgi:polysaccharide biosynthesis protein PslJ